MRPIWILLCLLLVPVAAAAQGTATLIADSVTVTAEQRLIAEGNVEVFYDGTRLSAARITYDRAADRLAIDGPIFIEAVDGTILTADSASLDPRLQNGLLRGARLVLEQQLQLAANRIDRIDGRYSALTQTAATSCQVCGNRPPLWEIRAARVVHDEVERQLYFENATFRVRGVPLLWVPRMRLPDPTLDRATGLLVPSIRTTNQLGVGVRIPYFIRIGDRRDLTLAPYISPQTKTLEARYRQAYLSGSLIVEGAVTQDTIRPDETRGYLNARGEFSVGPVATLTFNIEHTSDTAYLRDYGYSDRDRLASGLTYTRVTDRSLLQADLTRYTTLRSDEVEGSLPPLVARFGYENRRPLFGGTLTYGTRAETFDRPEPVLGDAGRDVARIGVRAAWSRNWLAPGGLLVEAGAGFGIGYYRITDDPDYGSYVLRGTPSVQTTLRWPLMRTEANGSTQVLEPFATLAWSRTSGDPVPNEDSAIVEFDEANLTALTRYPGEDAREQGTRAAIGLNWTRLGAGGTEAGLTFGRIFREQADTGFTVASGLAGITSDWMISGRLVLPGGVRTTVRTIFDDDFAFDKTEARIDWSSDRVGVATTYVWLPAEPSEDRETPISEWTLDARYRFNDNWAISAEGRYDLATDQPVSAGIGVGWRNECVTVDLSVSRSYTTSTEVEPVTDFGLAVNLTGFSSGLSAAAPPGQCRD